MMPISNGMNSSLPHHPTASLPQENLEWFDAQHASNAKIAGYAGDQQHHSEGKHKVGIGSMLPAPLRRQCRGRNTG